MNLDGFVRSPMTYINFAGFRATTLELQNRGWNITAYEAMDHASYRRQIQLMLNHDGAGITLVSQVELWERDRMFYTAHLPEVQVVGLQLGNQGSRFMPHVKPFDLDFSERSFSAIDCTPSYEKIDLHSVDLFKFGVFKKINDTANIFLPEKTVNELMDEILSKHKPVQDEIRKNRKRDSFMQEFNRNPNEQIKLQLVAI